MIKRITLIAVFLVPLSTAAAEPTPIEKFCGEIRVTYAICSLEQKILNIGGQLPVEPGKEVCLKTYKAKTKPPYSAALKSVKNKPSAAGMTKDVYAAFLASVQSLAPHSDELQIAYDTRVNKAMDDLGAACARLGLEVE